MKKLNLALLIGLVAAILVSNFTSFEKCYEDIQNGVLRLHILANSDSEEDQKLKIKVRDRLLDYSKEIFGEETDLESVEKKVRENFDKIKKIAEDVIEDNGFSYNVDAKLVNMKFDERRYGNLTMPAGNYDALRITIGEAEGKNWWCVMYPPLCIPAASGKTEDIKGSNNKESNEKVCQADNSEDFFSDEEYNMLTHPEKYRVKFKILEVYKDVKKKIEKF